MVKEKDKVKETPEWLPTYYTEPIFEESEAPFVIELVETLLKARDGFKAGEPIKLAEWQKWVLTNILEVDESKNYRYNRFLLMIPRKNGKTFLSALLVIYHLLTAPDYAEIYSAGKDSKQAAIVYNMVRDFINETPLLKKRISHSKTSKTFTNIETKAFYRPLSADAGGLHGLNPFFVIADELHVWEGQGSGSRAREFWQGLTSGMGARPNSQLVIISTAGANVTNSILGGLYTKGKKIVNGEEKDKFFGFICWEASEQDDPRSIKTWKKANPNIAEGLINEKYLESELLSSTATGLAGFLRMNLNIWARLEGDPFINLFYWEKAYREDYEIPKGSKITVGFDGSQTADTTCLIIQEVETGHIEVWQFWEKDEMDPEWAINRDDVFNSLKRLDKDYDVELIWADATYWFPDIRNWNKHFSFHIEEVPPNNSRMIPIAKEFLQDLIEGELTHPNDEDLNRYSMNAIMRENGSFGKASNKMKDRIDLLVGAILANGARNFILTQEPDEPQEVYILR